MKRLRILGIFCTIALGLIGVSVRIPVSAAEAVPGDPLTGSGEVSRNLLTYSDLVDGFAYSSPVDENAFALPAEGAHPHILFEGRLEFRDEATGGGFQAIEDLYNYADDPERRHLPEFDFAFVQHGSHLIPVQRGLIITEHPYWNYMLEPGRVWKENGDDGTMRAAIPFALIQKNGNCTHNGVISFLFDASNVSNVWYQITQETCQHFKADLWGLLEAVYHPETIANAEQVRADYVQEVVNRYPSAPIAQLEEDYPGIDAGQFGRGVTPEHMSVYGLVVGGRNYVGGCETRYGHYAYCGQMRLASFSTAKSAFAGVALMRMAQQYGLGLADEVIGDWVSETATSAGVWSNVTFDNALDMATGNYQFSQYMFDENSALMDQFFAAETYDDKMAAALSWPNQTAPGAQWVYHTSDSLVLVRALQNYLQSRQGVEADIFDYLVGEVFGPLRIGPGAYTSLRTSENNWQGQALGGYGLWWTSDDVPKLAEMLSAGGKSPDDIQLLQSDLLAAALQQDPTNRGVDTGVGPKYNNGFWADEFTPEQSNEYECTFWTPYMSGYGGITIALMPNGATYYYFSDNGEYVWHDAVAEANKIRSHCRFDVMIAGDGEDVTLTWQTQRWHESYQVWRSGRPYFEPGDSDSELWRSLIPEQYEELSVVDEGAAGDPNDNTYYLVKALDAESQVVGVSNRVGEHGYAVVQGN